MLEILLVNHRNTIRRWSFECQKNFTNTFFCVNDFRLFHKTKDYVKLFNIVWDFDAHWRYFLMLTDGIFWCSLTVFFDTHWRYFLSN